MTVAADAVRESDEVYAAILVLRRRGFTVRRQRAGQHLVNGKKIDDSTLIAMAQAVRR